MAASSSIAGAALQVRSGRAAAQSAWLLLVMGLVLMSPFLLALIGSISGWTQLWLLLSLLCALAAGCIFSRMLGKGATRSAVTLFVLAFAVRVLVGFAVGSYLLATTGDATFQNDATTYHLQAQQIAMMGGPWHLSAYEFSNTYFGA